MAAGNTYSWYAKHLEKTPNATPPELMALLRETEKMLLENQDFINSRIEKEISAAHSFIAANNKPAALQALNKKRAMEKLPFKDYLQPIQHQIQLLQNEPTNAEFEQIRDSTLTAFKNMFSNDEREMVDLYESNDFEAQAKGKNKSFLNPSDDLELLAEYEEQKKIMEFQSQVWNSI